ncbi:hypothetical protein GWE18_12530 [Bradyrhizobium sp. CSA112]|uniref:hypothetical protein n=1 Tax=Bradyrhizobium sp. CSA112 TaxID=2699170 RepID=UPI0023B01F6C|nr:hypothetical protein [Bradyrhizobium sp. CSA112]MDE5453674.1 hypothetical protein [Bradyrhizobium sp. CSA112]
MGQSRVLHSHMSSQRDSWWYLVQDDNGALFIDYENDVSPEDGRTRTPINEFIAKDRNGAVRKAIQLLIDRMFEDRDAKGS